METDIVVKEIESSLNEGDAKKFARQIREELEKFKKAKKPKNENKPNYNKFWDHDREINFFLSILTDPCLQSFRDELKDYHDDINSRIITFEIERFMFLECDTNNKDFNIYLIPIMEKLTIFADGLYANAKLLNRHSFILSNKQVDYFVSKTAAFFEDIIKYVSKYSNKKQKPRHYLKEEDESYKMYMGMIDRIIEKNLRRYRVVGDYISSKDAVGLDTSSGSMNNNLTSFIRKHAEEIKEKYKLTDTEYIKKFNFQN